MSAHPSLLRYETTPADSGGLQGGYAPFLAEDVRSNSPPHVNVDVSTPPQQYKPTTIGFDDFLDAITCVKVPARKWKSRQSSESTVELPRAESPPYSVPYPFLIPVGAPFVRTSKPRNTSVPKKTRRSAGPDTNPSQHGLDGHITSCDAHRRRDSARRDRDTTTKQEGVKFYYCSKCGRYRSQRFHRDHPVTSRSSPVSGICRRCLPTDTLDSQSQDDRNSRTAGTEVEEILVHRIRGSPNANTRCRSPDDIVRVIRHRRPSSPQPHRSRARASHRSSSSGSVTRVPKTRKQLDGLRDKSSRTNEENATQILHRKRRAADVPSAREPLPAPAQERLEFGSRNWTRGAPDDSAAQNHTDTDRRIVSHPNAWGHCRKVPIDPVSKQTIVARERDDDPLRPPSPPEWYYRHFSIEPIPPKFTVKKYRVTEKPREPSTFHRNRPEVEQKPRKQPENGILRNPLATEKKPRSPRKERKPPPSEDDEGEDEEDAHIRFAKGTNRPKEDWKWKQAAVNDWKEEKHDQHEFDVTKRHLRESVKRGAGALEVD